MTLSSSSSLTPSLPHSLAPSIHPFTTTGTIVSANAMQSVRPGGTEMRDVDANAANRCTTPHSARVVPGEMQ